MPAPGVPVIRNINWGGLKTLYVKEVRRFFKVQLQTIWAPAIQTLLFLVVFTVAMGGRSAVQLGGVTVAFADFIGPGLIIMGMLQNAFANARGFLSLPAGRRLFGGTGSQAGRPSTSKQLLGCWLFSAGALGEHRG